MSRKINLANYGGKAYESFDISIEREGETVSAEQVQAELLKAVGQYIENIPKESAWYIEAMKKGTPTIPTHDPAYRATIPKDDPKDSIPF